MPQVKDKEADTMKKLFGYADEYLRNSDWKDMAMLKFCLFSIGILAGMRIPEKARKRWEQPRCLSLFLLIFRL